MVSINGIIINSKDLQSPFLCNTTKCKGACCFIEGEFGAPLMLNELEEIKKNFTKIQHLLPDKSLETIKKEGLFLKQNGTYYTNVVNHRECVFAYFESGIARCSFESAYNQNLIDFRKPISCHLFPLREYRFLRTELVYVRIKECNSAIENGREKNVSLLESVKDALIRRFGNEWVETLLENLKFLPIGNNNGGRK